MNPINVTLNPPAYEFDIGAVTLELVRKHNLAVDTLTEHQVADAIRQAIECGDFVRNVVCGSGAQSVIYLPGRGLDELRANYDELIYAVARKYEGETRHETALRYIREREASTGEGNCGVAKV